MTHQPWFKIILLLSALAIDGSANSAYANEGVEMPPKIKESLLKRHPQASELQAEETKHFGNALIKVTYKDQDEVNMLLFRSNGALFSNVLLIEDPTPLPSPLVQALKNEFPAYEFKKAEMFVNPNGSGEEYEVFLIANGMQWLVSINDQGQVFGKRQY